ncbi:MAG: hypothetical protein ACYDBB_02430 [Armatimonadota bacterium]
MASTIFYSWQSDLPSSSNRNLIADALEKAVKQLSINDKIEFRIEHDTTGIAGSPNISQVIIDRINRSSVFVCDLSIINKALLAPEVKRLIDEAVDQLIVALGVDDEAPEILHDLMAAQENSRRPVPNPNVLFELGYALAQKGDSRILMVMNTAYGQLSDLPFDLQKIRVKTYNLPKHSHDKAPVRKDLVGFFVDAIRAIHNEIAEEEISTAQGLIPSADAAINAIELFTPNQSVMVKRFNEQFVAEINGLIPEDTSGKLLDELLVELINSSEAAYIQFIRVTTAAAETGSMDAAKQLLKGLGVFVTAILQYDPSPTPRSIVKKDLFRFLVDECFVTIIALLLEEDQIDMVSAILERGIYVDDLPNGRGGVTPLKYLSSPITLLDQYNKRQAEKHISIHGKILRDRHSTGEVGDMIPFKQYVAADFLLWLRDNFIHSGHGERWYPWTLIYRSKPPNFIWKAEDKDYAQQLAQALHASSIDEMRAHIKGYSEELESFFSNAMYSHPLDDFDPSIIASR